MENTLLELPLQEWSVTSLYYSGIDISLIKKNLLISIDERFLNLTNLQKFALELKNSKVING